MRTRRKGSAPGVHVLCCGTAAAVHAAATVHTPQHWQWLLAASAFACVPHRVYSRGRLHTLPPPACLPACRTARRSAVLLQGRAAAKHGQPVRQANGPELRAGRHAGRVSRCVVQQGVSLASCCRAALSQSHAPACPAPRAQRGTRAPCAPPCRRRVRHMGRLQVQGVGLMCRMQGPACVPVRGVQSSRACCRRCATPRLSPLRPQIPGMLKIRHIGQTTITTGAVRARGPAAAVPPACCPSTRTPAAARALQIFGTFLAAGALLHCGKNP